MKQFIFLNPLLLIIKVIHKVWEVNLKQLSPPTQKLHTLIYFTLLSFLHNTVPVLIHGDFHIRIDDSNILAFQCLELLFSKNLVLYLSSATHSNSHVHKELVITNNRNTSMNSFSCVSLPDRNPDFQVSPFGTWTLETLRLLKDYQLTSPCLHLHSLCSRFSGFTFAKMFPLLKAFVLTVSSAWNSSPNNTHMATSLTSHKWWPPVRSPLTKPYLKLQSSLHHLLTSTPLASAFKLHPESDSFPFFQSPIAFLISLTLVSWYFHLLTYYVTHSFLHLLFPYLFY